MALLTQRVQAWHLYKFKVKLLPVLATNLATVLSFLTLVMIRTFMIESRLMLQMY